MYKDYDPTFDPEWKRVDGHTNICFNAKDLHNFTVLGDRVDTIEHLAEWIQHYQKKTWCGLDGAIQVVRMAQRKYGFAQPVIDYIIDALRHNETLRLRSGGRIYLPAEVR